MEKIKYLFLLLIVFGCIPNDKTATEYYVLDNPLYNYDVEEKIKKQFRFGDEEDEME